MLMSTAATALVVNSSGGEGRSHTIGRTTAERRKNHDVHTERKRGREREEFWSWC